MRKAPEPVVVFETSDAALIPVVESLLLAAGIPFEKLGAELQGLFAGGQLGGFNPVIGPVRFVVTPRDAQKARKLLARLQRKRSSPTRQ